MMNLTITQMASEYSASYTDLDEQLDEMWLEGLATENELKEKEAEIDRVAWLVNGLTQTSKLYKEDQRNRREKNNQTN